MTLTNFELIKLAKRRKIDLDHVVMKDGLKDIKRKKRINLQSSSPTAVGTHWVALYIENKQACYFDSFGGIPPTDVIRYCGGLKLGYNSYIIQNIKSTECGNFCLAYLEYLQYNNGTLFQDANSFANLFEHDTTLNDDILDDYMTS